MDKTFQHLIGQCTCFQVILIYVRRAVAAAQGLLNLVGFFHHVFQLVLQILKVGSETY